MYHIIKRRTCSGWVPPIPEYMLHLIKKCLLLLKLENKESRNAFVYCPPLAIYRVVKVLLYRISHLGSCYSYTGIEETGGVS